MVWMPNNEVKSVPTRVQFQCSKGVRVIVCDTIERAKQQAGLMMLEWVNLPRFVFWGFNCQFQVWWLPISLLDIPCSILDHYHPVVCTWQIDKTRSATFESQRTWVWAIWIWGRDFWTFDSMNNAKKPCFSVKVCKVPAHCVKWRIQNPTAFRIVMCFRKSFWLRCVQNIQPNLTCLIIVTSCCCAAYNRTVVILDIQSQSCAVPAGGNLPLIGYSYLPDIMRIDAYPSC